nr:large neutral amino acids transporter small subunit 1-like [Penaeus vannamei]
MVYSCHLTPATFYHDMMVTSLGGFNSTNSNMKLNITFLKIEKRSFGNRMLGVMNWTMPFFVACSTFGSLNGGIFASSRLFFVGAREGHLPQVLSLININNFTPVPSLVFLGFMTVFMLITSDMHILINYISFSESLFILMSIAALLWLRYKEPNRHRPIKVRISIP